MVSKTAKLFLLATPFLFAACIETSAPLCDNSTKVDIPGFDRTYTATILTDPEKLPQDQSITISRVAQGQYNSQGSEIATCQVGRWMVAETKTKHGTYQQMIVSQDARGLLTLNQLIVDREKLQALGVGSEVVSRPNKNRPSLVRSYVPMADDPKALVIRVDSPAARAAIAELAKPQAFGTSFY